MGARSSSKNHSREVKGCCILNEMDGYHITKSYGLDVMHAVIEGTLPVELACILFGLSVEDKIVDIDTVNRE